MKERLKHQLTAYGFLSPSLALLAVFALYPIGFTLYMSFHRWRILGGADFIGLENYLHVLQSKEFLVALRNTFVYSLVTVPLGLVLAMGSAMLLNRPLRARGFFRGVIFFPVTISMVVIALIWSWIFSENYGIVNHLLLAFDIQPTNWLTDPIKAFAVIMVLSVWKGFGYRVDGASAWDRFRHVTLPLLNPTTLFVTVISFIGSFQVFDQVYVMTEGGPGYSTTVLVHYIYEAAYVQFRMGKASAAACVLFLIILFFTWIQIRFIRPQTEDRP
jgi:multiple sugar transport system permease protein